MFIPKMIFLIVALFAVVILVKSYIITNLDVRDVEHNVLESRLLYSRNGLSYFDSEISRLYPGIIDVEKFQSLSLKNPNALDEMSMSYGAENPIIAAKISLVTSEKESIAYYNKDKYDKWEPRSLSGVIGGSGSYKSYAVKKYVLAKDGERIMPALLELKVIV